ncbi:MAG: hypothetical protein L6R40_002799 [Gallowayella cf. fulva]|nr:MAG: hypothetical protein L6R40_002799 [Xanthomendoza cf. fulva]
MPTPNAKSKQLNGEDDQQLQRIEILHQQLKAEQARAHELLAKLKDEELQASKKLLKEYQKQAKWLEKEPARKKGMDIGIPQMKAEEREIRELEARVSGLEGKVRGFEGLPPDRELALTEVEKMRKELVILARRRDEMFEGLVEGDK